MATSKWIGKKLSNRYLIEDMLGQGGMSAVYKASDPNLKRVVAIKMIHTHLSDDPNFVQRFEEEASSVAQLRHPGIIQVFDFNKDDDIYYMVLEFVPGETFQEHLRRLNKEGRRLSGNKVAEYMAGICDAVDYAHQRGMIHRDIKPANLMLSTQGQAILMDFGIAKIVGGQSHTATGAVVGTAMYMSPEQIRGESPDRRSDIYSLGVTLFEMVGGQPPFQADSAMTLMMMHVNDPVPDVKELNPDVPNGLVAVINKALAKDPKDRYQTAGEMAADLRNIMGGTQMATSVDVPAPAATMLEEVPPTPEPDATALEQPPAVPQGTVVESESIPPSGDKTDVGGTVIESTAVKPEPLPQASSGAPPDKRSGLPLPVILGGLGGLAILIIAGIFLCSRGGGENAPTEEPPVAIIDTAAPTITTAPTNTEVVPPTMTPTETAVPPTPTPDTPYVVITEIGVENNVYVVDFEMHNSPSDLHVHMFFDTVPPDQAGSPGAGPWKLVGNAYGPSPFTGYTVANRPPNATQMCALIANPNHSVQPRSGNCVDLP
ncbi:MAG TPA: protein kinase [Anaerolineales bacterium]|nr:protein kinase [Anaerolineales bacterium]